MGNSPSTAPFWTPQGLEHASGGRWLVPPSNDAVTFRGLSTDSRQIKAGQVFLALRGESFDGHEFLAAAVDAGAGAIIIDRAEACPVGCRVPVLLVTDTLIALQQLAARFRDVLAHRGVRVICVCGSNGKTTTRNLIHTVLTASSRRLTGTQSPRSFNNHVGVPLTLLAAGVDDDFVVVEVGSNHPGEIAALGAIVRPDAAVITSIGHEHMEFFKTLEGVAQEEAAILRFIQPGGLAVVSQTAWKLVEPFAQLDQRIKLVRYGDQHEECELKLDGEVGQDVSGLRLEIDGRQLKLPLVGSHNALNALAALAIARWMALDDDAIAEAMAHAAPVDMRLQLSRLGTGDAHVLLINDAYNANPDSMAAGLCTLASLQGRRRVAILGDMRELGEQSPDLHRQVGRTLARTQGIDVAILIGKLSLFTAEALAREWEQERIHLFSQWSESLPDQVANLVQPGDVVLLKASRGMQLERLIPALSRKFPDKT